MISKDKLTKEVKIKSLRLIAEETGLSYSGIQYLVKRYNITLPPQHALRRRQSPGKSENIKLALAKKYPGGRFASMASNWRGGRGLHNGYIWIYAPEHPKANNHKRVFEHILVAEKKIGRYLLEDEIVHHINGNKRDNDPDNLEVVTRRSHVAYHMHSGEHIQQLLKRIKELEDQLKAA